MIWHIFKKDWKLTWPLVVALAVLHFAARIVQFKMGHFGGNPALASLLRLMTSAEYFGSAFLIAGAVHQDAIPGVRQDWLVRPISRRDLLLEKLIFVLLLVQGPVLAGDIFRSLLEGFSFHQSLAAALSRASFLLFFFYLPALTFASLTRNLAEAMVAGLSIFLGGGAFVMIEGALSPNGRPQFPVEWGGLAWIAESERALLALVLGITVLGLQYFYRKTTFSRSLFGGAVILWMLSFSTPWQPAFAVQERLSPNRGAANSVNVAFDPNAGRLASLIGTTSNERRPLTRDSGDILVGLPMQISNWPSDTMLKADHVDVRIMADSGKWLSIGATEDLELRHEGSGNSEKSLHHVIRIPAELYERFKDTPLQMEIAYSLTLMGLSHSFTMPALLGDERIAGVGWCKTRANDARTSIQLACLHPGFVGNCASVFLENTSSGQRNPVRAACSPNYSPLLDTIDGDAVIRMGMTVPFRDASGLAHYPVDGSQLADARVVTRLYSPVDHFSRRVLIPSIRLSDWVTQ